MSRKSNEEDELPPKPDGPLKRGWTTGACATAAAKAAAEGWVTGRTPKQVQITLPGGEQPTFAVHDGGKSDFGWRAAVIKDAGDDPDITHGAEIISELRPGETGSGLTFAAGPGVGTVTRPGLPLGIGEAAINPVPRRMIADHLRPMIDSGDLARDLCVTVSIPGGEALAEKTLNPRLGIVGGLSILGTTGIVVPYSCSSWIHSIHRSVDVARAMGLSHVAAATGSGSEAYVQNLYGLPDAALIEMGDFSGGLLKYLRDHPIPKLTLAGGFAKMAKLAQGESYLHSSASKLDLDRLASLLADLGADAAEQDKARRANTGLQVLKQAQDLGLDLAGLVARQAREAALAILSGGVEVEVILVDREGREVGRAG